MSIGTKIADVPDPIVAELERALNAPGEDLARAALALARLEHPRLDPEPWVEQLEAFGREAAHRVADVVSARDRLVALNEYLFATLAFAGNRDQYLDPRNSFLNDVIERRLGIPITLSIVYIEVGRRAGLVLRGISFPGHFLVRCDPDTGAGTRDTVQGDPHEYQVIDPFNRGALLTESDCQALLREHVGENATWSPRLLDPADRRSIILRMLGNLKRAYVALRSFAHARRVSDVLIAVDPSAITELRDRGLLSYHLQDFSLALRDLERYLQLSSRTEPSSSDREAGEDDREEHKALWEHVKNLRRRVASFN